MSVDTHIADARGALAGDNHAFARINKQFAPMAKRCASILPTSEWEDAEQLCSIALRFEVLPAWERNNFAGHLPPLVQTIFRRTVAELARSTSVLKRGAGIKRDDFDAIAETVIEHGTDPAEIIANQEQADLLLAKIIDAATPMQRRVLPNIIAGQTAGEIDDALQLATGATKNAISKLRKRMQFSPKVRAVCQVTLSGQLAGEYQSIREAGRATGIPAENISMAIRGKISQAGGFKWIFQRGEAEKSAA